MTVKLDRFKELQALPVSTVILGSDGAIVGVNDAWKDFADTQWDVPAELRCWRELPRLLRSRADNLARARKGAQGAALRAPRSCDLDLSLPFAHPPAVVLPDWPAARDPEAVRHRDPACRSHEGAANSNPCPRGQVEGEALPAPPPAFSKQLPEASSNRSRRTSPRNSMRCWGTRVRLGGRRKLRRACRPRSPAPASASASWRC